MDILFTLKLVKGVFAILDLFVWARLIISWIPHDPYNDITRIVYKITEPMLKPIRETGFSMKAMDRSMKYIENILFETLGNKLTLSFQKNVPSSTVNKNSKSQKMQDSDPKDEEVFNKVVDLFDGEILR